MASHFCEENDKETTSHCSDHQNLLKIKTERSKSRRKMKMGVGSQKSSINEKKEVETWLEEICC
jgi:ABC-type glutathione transport system ATPase component